MSIPVTRTRIILPRRRPDLVSRERLLEMLDDLLEYKLILVSAPAGYGKTSLLVDLAHQVEYPVCWYSLDSLDQDFQRFLAHFISAIQHRFPDFGHNSLSVLENASLSKNDRSRLVRTIVNDAFEHIDEHFTMVLDDYHLVEDNDDINLFLNRLIKEMDENYHQIISSRTLLNLPDLPLMVGRSQVKGLSFEELAFRPQEIQTLMQEKYHQVISEKQAQNIAERTDGWVTGLLLSAETMWKGLTGHARVSQASGVDLYDYLAQQVLDQQLPEFRSFLLRSSLLEEFNASLCEAVLGDPPEGETWSSLIAKVMQYNLFVQPLENEGTWLRYNHLFRDFLQERLSIERPEEKNRLLHKMIEVFSEWKEWEKAYSICQQLGKDQITAQLIKSAGGEMIKKGQLNTLARWTDALPERVLDEHPLLLARRGAVAMMLGDVKKGLPLLNEAERIQRSNNDISDLIKTLVWQASANRFLGNYQESLKYAEEALNLSEDNKEYRMTRAEALKTKGLTLFRLGNSKNALQTLQKSIDLYIEIENTYNAAQVNMDLGMIYMQLGQYSQANNHNREALQEWERENNITQKANMLNNMGVLANLQGHYLQAKEHFQRALEFARESGYQRVEGFILTSLGDLYADLEAYTAVKENYTQSKEISREIGNQYLLNYLDITQASLARKLQKHVRAHHLLDDAEPYIKESGSSYERGLFNLERGKLYLSENQTQKSIPLLEAAVRDFENGGQRIEAAQAHLHLAQAHDFEENRESSIHHIRKAFQTSSVLESLHPLIHSGREVKSALRAAQSNDRLGTQVSRFLDAIRDFEKELPSLQHAIYQDEEELELFIPGLSIQALGRAQVKRHGKAVSAPEFTNQRTVRELFFFLLVHPDGLRKRAIGQALWPESSPEELKRQFKNAVYRLRRALGKEVVIYDQSEKRYRFNWGLDYRYDVEDFRTQLSRAHNAESDQEQTAALESAISFYRHPYLPRVTQLWVEPIRNRLFRRFKDAVLTLAELYLDFKEYENSIHTCQRLLSIDPCQERAHRLSMRAHAALGDRAAVARQYQSCRKALSQDLDTSPSPETDELYRELMD